MLKFLCYKEGSTLGAAKNDKPSQQLSQSPDTESIIPGMLQGLCPALRTPNQSQY